MSAIPALEPAPFGTPVVQGIPALMHKKWQDWLSLILIGRMDTQPFAKTAIQLTKQAAAIGSTPLLAVAAAGVYRVSWYSQVTTIDGVASAEQITITGVYNGKSIPRVGANVNGDSLTSTDQGSVVVQCDAGSILSYAVSYASNTPGTMQFSLSVIVEPLN